MIDPWFHFVFKYPVQRRYLFIALASIAIQFIVFKYCYPFADYFTDSYTYIDAAASHDVVSFRPIGYSWFLRWVHMIMASDTLLIAIQYLVLQLGGIFLFFSCWYFFNPGKAIRNTLFIVLLFNPVLLYISNYVSSDALFVGLCLLWFTQLLWIIYRPSWYQLFTQAILLFCIFNLRYAALYFPLITIFAFLLSRQKWLMRIAGIVLGILPILIEIQALRHITKKETGTAVFSAFGGWTTANNALHIYPYIKVNPAELPNAECVALNDIVKKYFDTVPQAKKVHSSPGVDYLWNRQAPLKQYLYLIQEKKNIPSYFNAWHAVSPVFATYGNYLIRHHPVAFARYYLWLNIKTYFNPPLESLLQYNEGKNEVDETASKWFRYKNTSVRCLNKTIQGTILYPIPWLFCMINIIFLAGCIYFLIRFFRNNIHPFFYRILWLLALFWATNFCFSIYAISVVFRFELFATIVMTTFIFILLHYLLKERYHSSPVQ